MAHVRSGRTILDSGDICENLKVTDVDTNKNLHAKLIASNPCREIFSDHALHIINFALIEFPDFNPTGSNFINKVSQIHTC